MTITFTYQEISKKQAKNPFCRITTETQEKRLHLELRRRLFWLTQLGSSPDSFDQEFYSAFAVTCDSTLFGRSPEYDNHANTGLAVLSGAVEKLYSGDLSTKQIKYIMPLLRAMNEYYPKLWQPLEFHRQDLSANPGQFSQLFDAAVS